MTAVDTDGLIVQRPAAQISEGAQLRIHTLTGLETISFTELRNLIGISKITETVLFSQFTDGLGVAGTYLMAETLPVGARVIGVHITVNTGFTGDTTAVAVVGDSGGDVDRYLTGTPSVLAAGNPSCGVPSGILNIATAVRPTVTVTGGADFTSIVAGSMTVTLAYFKATA